MKFKPLIALLFALLISLSGTSAIAESAWFVLMHTPGPAWNPEVSFVAQKGVSQHRSYMNEQLQQGNLVLGGPFQDNSGGMMILKVNSIELAMEIANEDPAVQSGLLNVEVKSWLTPLSRMSIVRNRKKTVSVSKDLPFKVKSPSSGAPINIQEK